MTTKSKMQEKKKLSDVDENISKLFDIKKRLGKGAYGIVWKALDKRTNETLAVKKIFDAFRDETDAQRTFREICFLQSFRSHPNVVKMLNVYRAANNLDIYLVFEYMESDLHNIIKKGTILKDIHKRFVMYQLLNAIRYIHSGNVIHRDLKPSNVLIDSKCRCKLADFGLARSLSSQPLRDAPGSAEKSVPPLLTDYVATRWYRAPEILVASKRYTKGIDMWSLGCILGEMIRGKPLFQGSSTINQIEKIISALPDFTDHDINAVGASFGSVLLSKQASTERKTCLEELIPDAPRDALDMVKSLLLLDPLARLTANEAINHPYVERFRHSMAEVELDKDILPPFRDDVRLTVSEYRTKLYEIAQFTGDKVQNTGSKKFVNNPPKRNITGVPPTMKPRESSKYLERTVHENPQINKKVSRISVNRTQNGLNGNSTLIEDAILPEPTRKYTKQTPLSPTVTRNNFKQFESNKAPNRNRIIEDIRNAQNPLPSYPVEKKPQQPSISRTKTPNRMENSNVDKRHSIDGGYGSLPADTGSSDKTPRMIQSKMHKSSSITKLNNNNNEWVGNTVHQQRIEMHKPPTPQATRPERYHSLHRSSSVIVGKVARHVQDSIIDVATKTHKEFNDNSTFCYDARIKKIELAVAGFKDDIRKFAKETKYHARPPTPTRSVPTLQNQYQQSQTRYPQVRSKFTGGNIAVMQAVSSSKIASTMQQQMVPAEGPIITNSNAVNKRHLVAYPSLQREKHDYSNSNHTGGSGDHIGRNYTSPLDQNGKSNDRYKYKIQHHHLQQQQQLLLQQQHHQHQQHQHQHQHQHHQSRNRVSSKVI